jgi:outer membrane receptor protein involved in Fe transport
MNALIRAVAALLGAALLCISAVPAAAQSGTATITGLVIDQKNALPVSGATVTLAKNGTTVQTATTNGSGRYTINGVVPGVYDVTINARGYSGSQSDEIAVVTGQSLALNAALYAADINRSGLATIGHVSSGSSQLSAATTISQSINTEDLTRTGQLRVADQLSTLPAVNFSTSSSVGDDASINLRGFGSSETAMLLDGHPVGPMGVGATAFNVAMGPAFGLSRVDVTYGSGAQGLYGNDTIGGAVNYVTIAPTAKMQNSFQQQVGGFGISSTGFTSTGTVGRLGYALAGGRLGEYGDFAPTMITQTARPNNASSGSVSPDGTCQPGGISPLPNVSPCNNALNTYLVSQNTMQTVGVAKLAYSFSNVTKLEATAYDGVEWADSTGNGDNDYTPYSTRLGQVLSGTSNCTAPDGSAGYQVVTTNAGGTQCYTAAQYANASYGPNGGGENRQRSTRMGDYHMRLTTQAGFNNITVDGFANNYVYWKDSSLAGGIDPNNQYLGAQTYAQFYNTKGLTISDEITGQRNDLAFGYSVWHQLYTGNENDAQAQITYTPQFFGESSGFLRDTYQLADNATFFANAWLKHSSVSDKTTFDPRATIQVRPTRNDVFQFTYGRSDGAPSPTLKSTQEPVAGPPGASLTSVNCAGYNNVTSSGNPNLLSESANDFEFGYGHKFKDDSNIQVNAYDTHVTNQLFGASEPVLQFGAGNINFLPGALLAYEQRFATQCGLNLNDQSILQYLSVGTTYNVASALARGVELSGRQRINRIVYVDYTYDIESSSHVGISNQILMANPTIINGGQLYGIPLHQASISLDIAPNPWEFRIDNYYVEQNNGWNRPSFWHSNAFLTRSFDRGRYLLSIGGTNIFNNAVQDYGYIGLGTTPAVNNFNAPVNPSEEYGLAPAQLTLTLQAKM